jgi:hypothetical protein
MAAQPQTDSPQLESPLAPEVLSHLYENMLKARILSSRFRGSMIPEAILSGSLENAEPSDSVVSAEFDPVLEVLCGGNVASISSLNVADGPDRPPQRRTIAVGSSNVLGATLGLGLALRKIQASSIVLAFVPAKLTRESAWVEAINFAGRERLPVLFANDSTRVSTPTVRDYSHWPCPSITVDARDVIAAYRVTKEAASAARRGYGPTLINYISFVVPGTRGKDTRDPLTSFVGYLKRHNAWSEAVDTALENRLKEQFGLL